VFNKKSIRVRIRIRILIRKRWREKERRDLLKKTLIKNKYNKKNNMKY